MRRDLKREHFARGLAEAGKNSKAAWRVIHDALGKQTKASTQCRTFASNGRGLTDDGEISDGFCAFFSNVGPELASKVRVPTGKSYRDYLGPRVGGEFCVFCSCDSR